MKAYAIIPARGGSKGIPRKNLQVVGGRALVERCVAAAVKAQRVEAVFVSTDDAEIAACAARAGARVIQRPDELSGDAASSEAALLHACALWQEAGELPDVLVFLQATSPFTEAEDIDRALARLEETDADVVLGVAQYHRFQWAMDPDGVLTAIGHDQYRRPRRQELLNRFVETGALYVMKTRGFMQAKFRFFGRIVGHELPVSRMHEIDDPLDLEVSRAIAPLLDGQSLPPRVPEPLQAVVFDFDGVLTDDAVYVDESGREQVRASRRDGLGIELLRRAGIPCLVLSKERNPVVSRRCEKLRIECLQGIDDKLPALERWLSERGAELKNTVYVGNDINDIPCLCAVGLAIAVADADPRAQQVAHWVTTKPGGYGAVREICELLLARTPSVTGSNAGDR